MFYGIFMAKIVKINKKPSKGLFSLLFWCARLDLNQHARRHMLLRHTCIPISPLAQNVNVTTIILAKKPININKTTINHNLRSL